MTCERVSIFCRCTSDHCVGYQFEQRVNMNCVPILMNRTGDLHLTTEVIQVFEKGIKSDTNVSQDQVPLSAHEEVNHRNDNIIYDNSDQCFNNKCSENSTCVEEYGTYTCACDPGFEGSLCNQGLQCQAESCFNNGTCVEEPQGFHCNCTEGFNGTQCENNIDDCPTANPCLNGGTCQDGINTFSCLCHCNYIGFNCESVLDGICSDDFLMGIFYKCELYFGITNV